MKTCTNNTTRSLTNAALTILFFMILGVAPAAISQPVSESDSTNLAEFYDMANGDNWHNRSGWLEEPVSQWYGVEIEEVADGEWRVTALELPDNNVHIEYFHAFIYGASFQYLKRLDLSFNRIQEPKDFGESTGSLPFDHFPNLEELKLSGNKDIYGFIPVTLSELEHMRVLWLEDTSLYEWPKGDVPGTEFFIQLYEWLEDLEDYRSSGLTFGTPDRPRLLHPEDGVTNQFLPVLFSWEEETVHPHLEFFGIGEADSFRVQIAADEGFTDVLLDSILTGNGLSLTDPLSYDQHYYWRMQGINEVGTGLWTDTNTFHTMEEVEITISRKSFEGPAISGFSMIGDDVLILPVSGNGLHVMDAGLEDRYTLQVDGDLLATSSIAHDSSMYVASTNNTIYAFNKRGAPLWNAAMGGEMRATPAVDSVSNIVIIGVENSNVIALDRETGSSRWSFFASGPVRHSAVIGSERILLVPSSDGTIYGVDLDSESEDPVLWEYSLNAEVTANPSLGKPGFAYFVTDADELVSLQYDRQGASEHWNVSVDGGVSASPVIDGENRLFVVGKNGQITALDGENGSEYWQVSHPHPFVTTPALGQDRLYTVDQAGYVYALSTGSGSVLWNVSFDENPSGALLYANGSLYIGSESGNTIRIDESGLAMKMSNRDRVVQSAEAIPYWSSEMGNNQRTGTQPSSIAEATSGSDAPSPDLPQAYQLDQNYPNPFNPGTMIRFHLPGSSFVTLDIFDISGKKVTTLVQEQMSAGRHEVGFDASGLSSGVYIYRLHAGEFMQTRQMTLVK